MKNGCKAFTSPTMDKIKIDPYHENRLHDIVFAKVKLRHLNRKGAYVEDTMRLIQELYEYIIYLYSHIEQLEKDKRYLLTQKLKNKQPMNKVKTEPCKYVLKLTDNLYNNWWGYCVNGVIETMGKEGFFTEESVFNTYEEAKQYISYLLSTGWYRPDITESSFEVVEVWKRADSEIDPFWYTDEELKRVCGWMEV